MQKQCVLPFRREALARNRGAKDCTLIFSFQAKIPIKYYVAKIRLFSSKKLQTQGRASEKMLTFQQADDIILLKC